jgi:hypothetical protein
MRHHTNCNKRRSPPNTHVEISQFAIHSDYATDRTSHANNFVLSYIGIDDTDVLIDDPTHPDSGGSRATAEAGKQKEPVTDTADVAAADKDTNGQELWSEVVSKRHRHLRVDTFQRSIVAAVYMDQAIKKRRENSLVVTGLVPTTKSDVELFSDLCAAEFHVQPDVVSVKRLGQPLVDRVQPLLVYLKHADQTKQLVGSARQLRRSTNSVVRETVFINPNLTKAEADAAYRARVQRRLTQQRQQQRRRNVGQPSAEQDLRMAVQIEGVATANGNGSQPLDPRANPFTPPTATSLQSSD